MEAVDVGGIDTVDHGDVEANFLTVAGTRDDTAAVRGIGQAGHGHGLLNQRVLERLLDDRDDDVSTTAPGVRVELTVESVDDDGDFGWLNDQNTLTERAKEHPDDDTDASEQNAAADRTPLRRRHDDQRDATEKDEKSEQRQRA